MFKIGDFSKLSRVPVKTLRYYDEIGLLKPTDIDRFTRYRYYSLEQLPMLYRILGLKELGFSLEQIARLLEGDLSPDQLTKMLESRRSEIEQQIQTFQTQLDQVEARLRQIEREGRLLHYEVILKEVNPQWVAAISGVIPSFDLAAPIFARLFEEAQAHLLGCGVAPAGPGLAVYHNGETGDEGVRVEIALPLQRAIPSSARVSVYELPGLPVAASVVHQGSFAALGEAYQALLGWIQANGYRIHGPTRELYLRFAMDGSLDQNIVEIQFPVKQVRKVKEVMEHKIVKLEKFLVVGMPYLGKNEHGEIGQMWQEFIPRIPEIQHIAQGPEISYGICSPNDQGLVDYIAALPVSSLSDIPEGMVGKEVPAQTYAVFESHGVGEIGHTYRMIQEEWFPASGFKPGDGPDFELYPESFDPDDPVSVLYIYFPVQES